MSGSIGSEGPQVPVVPSGRLGAIVALDIALRRGILPHVESGRNRRRAPREVRRRLSRRLYPADAEGRRAWLEQTWLRPGEVAALLQVSRRSVAAWARDGKIPFIETPGGHRRFRAIDVRRLVEALKVEGPAAG